MQVKILMHFNAEKFEAIAQMISRRKIKLTHPCFEKACG